MGANRAGLFVRATLLGMSLVFSLCLTNVALAEVSVCPLEEAMKRLEDYNIHLNAEIAEKQLPILNEMQTLTSKAKNPNLPTGAQLTKSDLDRFQQLREEMLTNQASVIVNSGYLRDSRVISRAAKVAHDLSVGRTFDEKDPDFFYNAILGILSIQYPQDKVEITTPQDKECSVVAGLHFDEQLADKQLNQLPWKETTDRLRV